MYKPNIDYYEGDDKDKIKDLLKNVTLYKLYNTFEDELKNDPAVGTCNEQCDAKLLGGSKEMLDLLNLCKSICNIISKVRKINGFCKGSSCMVSFFYLSFWLYEHVEKIKAQVNEINNFYEALDSIMKTKQSELKHCSIINFNKYINEFKPMKYLYEFMHMYKDIKDKITKYYNLNDQLYCKHIKSFFQYYNNIKENCKSITKPKYCDMISKIKTTFITENEIKQIYDKCKYEATSCKDDVVITDDLPCLKEKDISTIPEGSGDIKYILKIIYTASLSGFPVFVLLLILYKFTPLGVYIRSRINKKKNIHNHVGQEKYDLLKYTSNVEGISPDNGRYNVMYQ
ncbi:Plasmodium vivax Vir protein, putative [Plasmodium vivax]|uniref:Vir protein, putative n=1 Tax=Plasmodium vivax TaxID=5855 RepID=A0A1G4EC25_PLAVI|nr:PIR protein [Plasmodium vivax]SCA82096.1 Plasmodium vivax Vir protein, putative [Plasmodium vivax]